MLKRIFTVLLILFLVFPFVVTDADAPPEETDGEVKPEEEPIAEQTTENPIEENETESESLPDQEEVPNAEKSSVEETKESVEQVELTTQAIPFSPESELENPVVEPVSRHTSLKSPSLTVQDVSGTLVLTFTGKSPVGNMLPEGASIVFQLPDELIGAIEEENLSVEYQQALLHNDGYLVSESSGIHKGEAIRLENNQVEILLAVQDPVEFASDFTFTLRIPLSGTVDYLQTIDWPFYAQVVLGPTDLALLDKELVGYAVQRVAVEVTTSVEEEAEQFQPNRELTMHSMSTHSATATQTSRLTFTSVPEILEFEDVYMVDEEVTVVRKNADWSIEIEDTRGAGSTWSLMMRATPLTSTVDSTKTIQDALVFIDDTKNVKVTQDQDVEVHQSTTNENPVTLLAWDWNSGPLLRFNPSTVEAGSYRASITWTLVDAP